MIATATAPPCQLCGTTGGQYVGGSYRRLDARRYGGPPVSCRACFQRLYRHARKAGRTTTPPPEPVVREGACSPLPPRCSLCGTTGGRPRQLRGRPIRYAGSRAGLDGVLCHGCATADPARARSIFRPPDRGASEVAGDPALVRRQALAIQSEHARKGDRAEARRLEGVDRGPAPSAKEGAALALRQFDATMFGRKRPRPEARP